MEGLKYAKIFFEKIEKVEGKMESYFDVQDIIDAEHNLKPIVCRKCGSTEVTFNQLIGDAFCENCGSWQLELTYGDINK